MGIFDNIKKSLGGRNKKEHIPPYYDIVCPFCFKKYSPKEVVFRAAHAEEDDEEFFLKEDRLLNEYRSKFNLAPLPDMEAIIEDLDRIPEESKKYADGVLVQIIDKHGIATNKRLCPKCHNELPITAGKFPSNIISIVGASQVGKSVYMTSLIHTLQNFTAYNFDAACLPVSVDVSKKFRESYEEPLYDRGVLFDPTQKEVRQEPLMFQFKFKNENKPPVTLVFFDVAGEGMIDQDYMDIFATHIKNSAGILFLVDPLQIRTIRNKIDIKKGEDSGEFASKYDEPREVIISLFENFIGHQEKGKTDIPTAVVLTKSDMLRILSEDEYIKENSNIFYNVNHKNTFNLTEFENIDGEVKRFLEKVDRAFTDALEVHFKDRAFFAVSALGSNPIDRRVQGIVSPVRVDEPFLWLLYKLGYIEGSRSK
ncbi:TRAFAC clade GTPase domain-containing protein [Lutispora saccharofermentans]|uniref:Double-GTPase 2 domain-containing protein n=1 Tax=Lutispora saccharofermentans TaxID=3024236 RepID=A0ABT1NFF4_9FIRM|nr:hypothetical protein [Lutispora saccharofermentans]MCQ1528571.1 hypothetical protein [Lutispora saccharofermentans]